MTDNNRMTELKTQQRRENNRQDKRKDDGWIEKKNDRE